MRQFLISLFLLAASVSAQTPVSITGRVSNNATSAWIQGVVVSLKNFPAVACTTKVDGTYNLVGTVATIVPLNGFKANSIGIIRNKLTFALIANTPVTVDIFTAAGIKVRSLVNEKHPALGNYSLNINPIGLSSGLYFIRLKQGTYITAYRYILNRAINGPSFTDNSSMGLSKIAATAVNDTLVFNCPGYGTAKLAITNYSGTYNIALNPTTNHIQSALAKLDITDAKTLFIVNTSSLAKKTASVATDSNTLFKVTQGGYTVQVTCLGDSGDTITNLISPINMCNLSDNFLTVTFQNYGTYLVRKSDGAAFNGNNKLPSSFPDPWIYARSDLFKQQDSSGNIYYIFNQQVKKLTITDPNNLTVSTYSASGDQVSWFVVDKFGNMAYYPNGGMINRYRHASGGFENFSQGSCSAEWTDVNNDFIYGRRGTLNITRIIPSSPLGFENYGDTTFVDGCVGHLAKIKNKNKIVGEGCEYVYELYNQDGVVSKLPDSYFNVSTIKMLAASDNYYYIIGTNAALQSVVLKVDPNGHTYTNVLTTGDYDLYNLVVGSSDEIQFYALRMNDGKRVLAGIDGAGNITVLSVLDGSTITALERIN